ncbi:MAG TPA: hypothetical protein PLF31_03005 [Candidatus Paceibacterota bacterium]|nr:hypothetical protein [Candidatus Paceibacterota bacterium]
MSLASNAPLEDTYFPCIISSRSGDASALSAIQKFREFEKSPTLKKRVVEIEILEGQDTGICIYSNTNLRQLFSLRYEKRDRVYFIQFNPIILSSSNKKDPHARLRDMYNQIRAMVGKNVEEWHRRSAPLRKPRSTKTSKPRPRNRSTKEGLAYLFDN